MNDPIILGVRVGSMDAEGLITATVRSACKRLGEVVLPVNAHFLNLAARQSWLQAFANDSSVHVVADGRGVLLAARVLRSRIPMHIRFSEWVHLLFATAKEKGLSIFFLGAEEEKVRKARERVLREWPAIKIVGAHRGYFDWPGEVNDELVRMINANSPDILLVGMSMPVEERWVLDNRQRLNVGCIVLGAGCFEWLSGATSVAPRWVSDLHLEWLYRLIQEPQRLWRRYLIGNPEFLARVLIERRSRAERRGNT